jgi:2-succinyl-5-enolpyruvyl-6-hydroxy-3-cyclohexene-1-carboxylate synthase
VNPSTALARTLAAALPRLGVRHVVLSPGSRSAPLAYALAALADHLTVHVRLDERSAGFCALGLSRADRDGRPAAVMTTSGSAAANLYPAVLEASHAGVPLLAITADRPAELRGTGANQTTDQVRLFGTAVRCFAEVSAGSWPGRSAAVTADGWRNVLARAVAAAMGVPSGDRGPVQLNVAFDEPLTPDDAADPMPAWPAELTALTGLTKVAVPQVQSSAGPLNARAQTVVLAGDGAGPIAVAVAAAAQVPLLAEPSSAARAGGIPGYRLLLDQPGLGQAIQRVIVFGRPTLSRQVTRLLARDDVEVIVVSSRPSWPDVARRAAQVRPSLHPSDLTAVPDPDWAGRWQRAGRAAAAAIGAVLDDEAAAGRVTGPLIARETDAVTGPEDVLVAGASNPIRDLDLVSGLGPTGGRVLANRGLSGIDGLISTACGVALAQTACQVRVLAGDLTFLHDAGGLAVGALERVPDVQIVVADDSGGGIFELLEQGELATRGAAQRAVFERLFGTPQRVDLAALCAGYGTRYTAVKDVPGLRQALATPPRGLSVVHCPIDRSGRRDLGDRIAARVTEAMSTL